MSQFCEIFLIDLFFDLGSELDCSWGRKEVQAVAGIFGYRYCLDSCCHIDIICFEILCGYRIFFKKNKQFLLFGFAHI